MLFKSRKKYSIIFYLPTRNMHPPKLFNRARTKPCFFLSRLARIYARPRIPQAVPRLQEFSRKRKLSLAGTCLKPICPVQRKEYPHSSCRSFPSPSRPGIKKGPAASLLQDLQDGDYLLSHLRSTIGVTKLNFSVRNGKRWNLRAIVT